MNTDVMFSSATDLWSTPKAFFDKYHAVHGFDLDVCANDENAKCEKFYTVVEDGLAQEWTGNVWMNPPYGREIGKLKASLLKRRQRRLFVYCQREQTHDGFTTFAHKGTLNLLRGV